jgi:hypothetical protein
MSSDTESEQLRDHCKFVADALTRGRVVPFLGAGVNLCDRPDGGAGWQQPADAAGLPSGRELAVYLTEKFSYPALQTCPQCKHTEYQSDLDLARVSQYAVTLVNEGPLYDVLGPVFHHPVEPTCAHHFLANLSASKAERPQDRYPLIVTTNYDALTERAFGEDNFDLVFYNSKYKRGRESGPRFWHKAPGQPVQRIESANDYSYHFFEHRPVILKIHGTVDTANEHLEGFVITEDDYIRYLADEPLENFLPSALLSKMRGKYHLLFLGYSLRDWNLRVFLRRLEEERNYVSWAILRSNNEAEKRFWMKNNVDIIDVSLKSYIEELRKQLAPPAAGFAVNAA